jgi:hypothetical protein
MSGLPSQSTLLTRCRVPVIAAILCTGLAGSAAAQVAEKIVLDFDDTNSGGPAAPLLADTGGRGGSLRALYGTTVSAHEGLTIYFGSVFKLTPPKGAKTAWQYTTLSLFPKGGTSPAWPSLGGLFAFSDKIISTTPLYGTSFFGGNSNSNCSGNALAGCGALYSVTGSTLGTVFDFTGGTDGSWPYYGSVIGDKSGALYAVTQSGGQVSGPSGCGTVDKFTPPAKGQAAWTETTLWDFTGGNDGCNPTALVFDKAGALYGVAAFGGTSNNGSFFRLTPPQQGQTQWTETTLYSFAGGNDTSFPMSLTVTKNGVMYGVSDYSGSAGNGTVFALIPPKKGQTAWTEQVLWRFTGGSDGDQPNPLLIIDKAGSLYGTAEGGGTSTSNCDNQGYTGCGTVFKLSPPAGGQGAWSETTLYTFTGVSDGGVPQAGLTADKSGVLYGTTYGGGAYGMSGSGVVFSLTGTGFVPP